MAVIGVLQKIHSLKDSDWWSLKFWESRPGRRGQPAGRNTAAVSGRCMKTISSKAWKKVKIVLARSVLMDHQEWSRESFDGAGQAKDSH